MVNTQNKARMYDKTDHMNQ